MGAVGERGLIGAGGRLADRQAAAERRLKKRVGFGRPGKPCGQEFAGKTPGLDQLIGARMLQGRYSHRELVEGQVALHGGEELRRRCVPRRHPT